MDEPVEFTPDFLLHMNTACEFVVTVRYIYKWLVGTKLEFAIGDTVFEKQPSGLRALSEEQMQERTVLEIVNAPQHLNGEWKQVFDEDKNVIVKYFRSPEEEEQHKRNMEDDEIYYCF